MEMNRRNFLTGVSLAAAGLATGGARAAEVKKDLLPLPAGDDFTGMNGAFAALYTPFKADGSLNEEMIERQVEFAVASGLKGLYLTGSTGEGFLLTTDERKRVYSRAVKASKGRLKLIAHVGCLATGEAIDLARHAAKVGIDWTSSVAPVYFGQNFDAAYDHYKQISEATDLPFMIYSVGQKVEPERDLKFFDLKNVKGMKYTGYAYWTVKCLRDRLSKPAIFFAGADEQEACAFAFGDVFSGCIGTTDNTIPSIHAALCAAAKRGDGVEMARLQDQVTRFVEVILAKSNSSWHKATMKYVGLDCGWSRAPAGRPLSDAELADLFARLDKLGFVKKAV